MDDRERNRARILQMMLGADPVMLKAMMGGHSQGLGDSDEDEEMSDSEVAHPNVKSYFYRSDRDVADYGRSGDILPDKEGRSL